MRLVPLLFFFFFLIPLSLAVLDVRDVKYTEMYEQQMEYFGEKEHVVAPPQDVRISGLATAQFATSKRLRKEYGGSYWMQRSRALQNKVNPLTKSLMTNNPADVAWEKIKREARDNLGDPSQERILDEEYDSYWLERSLETYQYLALHNPEIVQKKIAPLVYTNMKEYLPYLTEVLNKRSLTVEYSEEYWQNKNQKRLPITTI